MLDMQRGIDPRSLGRAKLFELLRQDCLKRLARGTPGGLYEAGMAINQFHPMYLGERAAKAAPRKPTPRPAAVPAGLDRSDAFEFEPAVQNTVAALYPEA
ncbi:hypothetical protein AIOL_003698 [Candidatus Rhodobacter oscarellae]|uniref:Uncharacterized protein n=1 Tax=Candidatus Rhodobacter oscarellae TaxID=1675527 RepID=A0A0J9EAN0_9RHOB|nr:hypothetical protein [Candidatus Rhodobacter lobularis]KMW58719.1 hypothetical protein AIOL_003698 [Candidatus Rhodobacter lobularis]